MDLSRRLSPLCGPYGQIEPALVGRVKDSGGNALWFHGFDEELFEQCEKQGLHSCVEMRTFRADFNSNPHLVPIGADGKPIRYGRLVQGVCLSQKAFLEQIESELIEGVKAYKPAGIWLDYLTYAGWFETPEPDLQDSCYCKRCIAEFCETEGVDADSPWKIQRDYQSVWTRHKCRRIATYAARYAEIIKSHLRTCLVGAYMCPYTPAELDGALARIFAQDYNLLSEAIDVFTPLIYAEKSARGSDWGRRFLESSPGFVPPEKPVQPILDYLDFPDSLTEITRSEVPAWGFQMFSGAKMFEREADRRLFSEAVEKIAPQWD
jgi:hypothetical protein